jgi:hypothetical protein
MKQLVLFKKNIFHEISVKASAKKMGKGEEYS